MFITTILGYYQCAWYFKLLYIILLFESRDHVIFHGKENEYNSI